MLPAFFLNALENGDLLLGAMVMIAFFHEAV